jgi:hypothetical protein
VRSAMPDVLHAPWCDPSRHVTTMWGDQHCRSEQIAVDPFDADGPHVSVERAAYRDGDSEEWVEEQPTVLVEVERGNGVELRADDALALARTLLAAHAIATGTAVTW